MFAELPEVACFAIAVEGLKPLAVSIMATVKAVRMQR